MTKLTLEKPLNEVSGIGKKTYAKLTKQGFSQIKDLLTHYPKTHLIYKKTSTTNAKPGDHVILHGKVTKPTNKRKGKLTYQSATLQDQKGTINLRWFNQPYLARSIKLNSLYEIRGRVENFYGQRQIVNPQTRKTKIPTSTHLSPQYAQRGNLKSNWFERFIKKILSQIEKIPDPIPSIIRSQHHLIPKKTALQQIHFPTNFEQLEKSHQRLSFEELFLLQKQTLQKKKENKTPSTSLKTPSDKLHKFIQKLEFQLTNSQIQSIKEIKKDLGQKTSMDRLLLGDVGSGKTIVAIAASYITHLNEKKTLVMAPTQILAQQLKKEFQKHLTKYNISIKLLTGQTKESGSFDILIGTHALIQNFEEKLDKVGLIIIDEEHKFGVKQRGKLAKKTKIPHQLTMSATPIPRTLALTLFSNLDVSHLKEMPKGRKKVKTYLVPEKKRPKSYQWIKKLIKQEDYKIFVVTPLIEESDHEKTKHLKSLKEVYQNLQTIFSKQDVGIIHGNFDEIQKNQTIESFKKGDTKILASTTVIEVGIDVPEANIIIIESAERFGLSQLHQLRGRVGRSEKQGYCLLFTTKLTPKAKKRLNYFINHNQGAKLAKLDMQLRGPGKLWGTQQHGFFNLKLANIFDQELVQKTHQAAIQALDL